MNWDGGDLVSLGVAIIAALGMYLSHRSSSKASVLSAEMTARLDAEKEAYGRARKMDVDTIERQDHELETLRERLEVARSEAREARREAREAHNEVATLRRRVTFLENQSGYLEDPDHA